MLRWREKKLSTMFVCLRDRCRFRCGSRGQHSSPCAVRPSRLLRLLTFWTGGIRSRLPAQRLFTLCKAHEWPRVALTLRMAKQRGVCMSGFFTATINTLGLLVMWANVTAKVCPINFNMAF